MAPFAPSQYVEQFHLVFLAQLGRKVDKKQFVLKGGCNLRFFLRSVRYSEDMDLDVRDIDAHVLRDKVNGILRSQPFAQILRARGIQIEHVTVNKQTDTTQRWKVGLRTERADQPLPTRIEFSRRGMEDDVRFESADHDLIRAYQLSPVMASHYTAAAAFRQKLGALASRRATQARDVFDLHHLVASGAYAEPRNGGRPGTRPGGPGRVDRATLEKARTNALAIGFDTFKSQVLAYFSPEDQAQYDSAPVWDTIVLEVVEALGGAQV